MKPKQLIPLALMLIAVGGTWLYTLWNNAEWYVENIQSDLLLSVIIITVSVTILSGIIIILDAIDRS